MKDQNKTLEKELSKIEKKQATRCRVQNTSYKDAQGI